MFVKIKWAFGTYGNFVVDLFEACGAVEGHLFDLLDILGSGLVILALFLGKLLNPGSVGDLLRLLVGRSRHLDLFHGEKSLGIRAHTQGA